MARFFYAVKAIIFHENEFLLIRRTEKTRGHHFCWELPGGRLEFGETPDCTLLREVQEEAGLTVKIVRPLSLWTCFKDESTQLVGSTSLCVSESRTVRLSEEHDQHVWTTYAQICNYNVYDGLLKEMNTWDWREISRNVSPYLGHFEQ